MPTDAGALDIQAVVFDLGGVLLDWNPRHLYRKVFADERGMDFFLGQICTLAWHDAHDRGAPVEGSCARMAQQHPEHADLVWAWTRRSEEMIGGSIDGTVQILRELRERGIACYALTNMEAETFPGRRDRYEFLRWFDGTVVSAFEGVAKPDLEIFRRLLARFELSPDMTLFIDDAQRNVDAAASLGIQTVHFESADHLRRRLVELGLLEAGSGAA